MSCSPASTLLLTSRLTRNLFRSPLLHSTPSRPPYPRSPRLPQPSVRLESRYGHRNRRPTPRYDRFQRARGILELWRTSVRFRYGVGAGLSGGGGFYYYNLERVPITNRSRFNCFSYAFEERQGQKELQQTMEEYQGKVLPPDHPHSKLVTKVLQRLIPASGLADVNWEIFVIDDPEEKNAFVMPG